MLPNAGETKITAGAGLKPTNGVRAAGTGITVADDAAMGQARPLDAYRSEGGKQSHRGIIGKTSHGEARHLGQVVEGRASKPRKQTVATTDQEAQKPTRALPSTPKPQEDGKI
ncbi:hypothetical protein TRVL_04292 [Trypanosoma vivax]|nr:hypothetical protein TRVL_04292 [Trypanosoma vivax]